MKFFHRRVTIVDGHVLLLNSLDWTNTGIAFIFLTVNLCRKSTMKELHLYPMGRQVTTVNNTVFINYPMGELYIVSPVASLYSRTFLS